MKICFRCKKEKNKENFTLDNQKKDGLRTYCKECQQNISLQYKEKNRDLLSLKQRIFYKKIKQEKLLLKSSKNNARSKNLINELSLEDIVIPEYCPVLNIPLFKGEKIYSDNSPSIDRVDNSKGYLKDNIIIVSRRANCIKNNATVEELEKIVNFYKGLKK